MGLEKVSMIKSTGCSSRAPVFCSQHIHGRLQLFETIVSWNRHPFSDFGHACDIPTYMQGKHKIKIRVKEKLGSNLLSAQL